VSVSTVRVLVFSIAAFLAGAAGALFSAATGAADRNSYDAFTSLVWLALLAVCGRGTLRPSVIAAVTLTILPAYIERDIAQIQLMLFGGAAILAAVMSSKERGDTTRLDRAIATANSQRNPFAARSSDDGWRPPTTGRAGVVVP
jgi:ABC-type branched-subunit amino acid transport system permease subunit